MTKVQTNMIQVNLKAGNKKLACKLALMANLESGNQVYLDNAYSMVKEGVTRHEWAGYLSALEKDGCYKPQGDKFFGLFVG